MSLRHKPIKIYKKNIKIKFENNNFINNRFENKNNVELLEFIDIEYEDLRKNKYLRNENNKSIELLEYIDVEFDGLKDTKNEAFNNIIMNIHKLSI